MNQAKIQDKLDKKLKIAIYKNDIEKVEKLIEKGANPDTRIVKGIPALFLLCGQIILKLPSSWLTVLMSMKMYTD